MAELIFELNLTWFQKQGTSYIAVNLRWRNNVGKPLAWHENERIKNIEKPKEWVRWFCFALILHKRIKDDLFIIFFSDTG